MGNGVATHCLISGLVQVGRLGMGRKPSVLFSAWLHTSFLPFQEIVLTGRQLDKVRTLVHASNFSICSEPSPHVCCMYLTYAVTLLLLWESCSETPILDMTTVMQIYL